MFVNAPFRIAIEKNLMSLSLMFFVLEISDCLYRDLLRPLFDFFFDVVDFFVSIVHMTRAKVLPVSNNKSNKKPSNTSNTSNTSNNQKSNTLNRIRAALKSRKLITGSSSPILLMKNENRPNELKNRSQKVKSVQKQTNSTFYHWSRSALSNQNTTPGKKVYTKSPIWTTNQRLEKNHTNLGKGRDYKTLFEITLPRSYEYYGNPLFAYSLNARNKMISTGINSMMQILPGRTVTPGNLRGFELPHTFAPSPSSLKKTHITVLPPFIGRITSKENENKGQKISITIESFHAYNEPKPPQGINFETNNNGRLMKDKTGTHIITRNITYS